MESAGMCRSLALDTPSRFAQRLLNRRKQALAWQESARRCGSVGSTARIGAFQNVWVSPPVAAPGAAFGAPTPLRLGTPDVVERNPQRPWTGNNRDACEHAAFRVLRAQRREEDARVRRDDGRILVGWSTSPPTRRGPERPTRRVLDGKGTLEGLDAVDQRRSRGRGSGCSRRRRAASTVTRAAPVTEQTDAVSWF